jgi:NAD(P)-dependent dehydrogenase (short-subunit alcohol dehydrogenase family)
MADAFAAEGAHVVLTGRNTSAGERAVAEIRAAGGRADYVPADLGGGVAAVRRLVEDAIRVLGGRLTSWSIAPGSTVNVKAGY